MTMTCRVCHGVSESFASAQILSKYTIEYFRCRDCHFVQSEEPYWLDEAYRSVIVSTDVGLISRNERFARITDRVLRYVFPQVIDSVDYGGGYGMFTRMMRDRGHYFFHRDPHCRNLFAVGLEASNAAQAHASETENSSGGNHFDFLTAFEVFEHFASPHQELERLDRMADQWLISTEVLPEPTPLPHQWWYYVLDGGQHISLWSQRALQEVAHHYDRHLVSYRGLHLFSREKLKPQWVRSILRDRGSRVLDHFRKRRSLLSDDFQRAVAAVQNAA
ncbi:MAG: class I SAM-dependent methyltransferase [Planctomycetota bacterium]